MNYKIPTFEQAVNLVELNPDCFNHKIEEVDGHTFHIFSYRLANYEDFESNKDLGAYEMRGITYRHDGTGGYVCYPHLHKFFNISQGGIENSLKELSSQNINLVQTKEDGSMMVPIVVNEKIYWKTQRTFDNEQTEAAKKLCYVPMRTFIIDCFQADLIPIFEYVSPFNQIVLNYNTSELRLLQVRDIKTGEYKDMSTFISLAKSYNINVASVIGVLEIPRQGHKHEELQNIVNYLEVAEGIEGYILTFDNGHKVKAKTAEYFRLHRLLTENLNAENCLVEWVLDGVIDDMLCQVPEKDPRRLRALDIAIHVREYIFDMNKDICKVFDANYQLSRKDFAIKFQKHAFFSILMRYYLRYHEGIYEYDDIIIEYLKKKTNKLEAAREWLRSTGYVEELV